MLDQRAAGHFDDEVGGGGMCIVVIPGGDHRDVGLRLGPVGGGKRALDTNRRARMKREHQDPSQPLNRAAVRRPFRTHTQDHSVDQLDALVRE